jgi:regulator of sigma E protease
VKISGMNPDEELPPEAKGRGYYDQPVWKRIAVIAAGPAVNIVLAFLIFFVLAFGARDVNQEVGEIVPGSPAASALRSGDRILAVDGRAYADLGREERLTRFAERVASHECAGEPQRGCRATTPVRLRIARDGRPRTIVLRPVYDPAVGRTRLGFSYGSTPVHVGPGGAAQRSLDFMWLITTQTAGVFARLYDPEERKQVSGIVGISDTANRTINEFGAREALILLAVVSFSLGLINLFPVLPLDGGHIFWSVVEKVRGRRVPFRVMERAGALGFVLVIMLFVIGLTNDIGRLTGEGFGPR